MRCHWMPDHFLNIPAGTVEMTKDAYAKLHKDRKGTDPAKPTRLVLSPLTGGTEIWPVRIVKDDFQHAMNCTIEGAARRVRELRETWAFTTEQALAELHKESTLGNAADALILARLAEGR